MKTQNFLIVISILLLTTGIITANIYLKEKTTPPVNGVVIEDEVISSSTQEYQGIDLIEEQMIRDLEAEERVYEEIEYIEDIGLIEEIDTPTPSQMELRSVE